MSESVPALNKADGFTVTGAIAAGRGAVSGMAVSADGGLLTVTHYGDDSVSLIDTTDATARLTVTDVDEPTAVAMSGARAYVSSVSKAHDEVLAFDTHAERIVASYPVGFGITDLAVSPNGRVVYAGRTGAEGADVVVLDTATGKQQSIGLDAASVACVRVSADGRRLYVAANSASTSALVMIDTRRNRVLSTVDIGSPIRDIALSPDGAVAYIGSCGPDFGTVLDIVDTRSSAVSATYKIGDAAASLAQLTLSRNGERAYLVGDQHVTVWSTLTQEVLGIITVGEEPSGAVESTDGTRLYIGDYAGTVTELAISAAAAQVGGLTTGDEWTAPHGWAVSDLRMLEPTLA
ncbi:YncE family protein [Candidatus Mycobacterium wuenschmannii]|uniref:YncE family protein n=1 Tax=Candidatus Mycobacterium wuenschmannii TaxID=3027808 RepID=A0ABY8W2F7_9MYCO|nr:YncE family protein [Candidatus Mycobacterium wuenschmannii]WIM90078.1 YncE family protein [Candidatus Mycobacterium wuenschmannii]